MISTTARGVQEFERRRERPCRAGPIHHEHLFFTEEGTPIQDAKYPYRPWRSTRLYPTGCFLF
jgi:hypothetical protein